MAAEAAGPNEVDFATVDTDAETELAAKYKVGHPMLLAPVCIPAWPLHLRALFLGLPAVSSPSHTSDVHLLPFTAQHTKDEQIASIHNST